MVGITRSKSNFFPGGIQSLSLIAQPLTVPGSVGSKTAALQGSQPPTIYIYIYSNSIQYIYIYIYNIKISISTHKFPPVGMGNSEFRKLTETAACAPSVLFLESMILASSHLTVQNWFWREKQEPHILIWFVVWNIFYFFHILGIIIPTDFHIFQRGRSTTNQLCV